MGIEVHGIQENAQSLEDFARDANNQEPTFIRIGGMLVEEAKSIVPVRTGKLRGSIVANATEDSVKITAGNGSVEYAGVIHRQIAYLTIAQYRQEDKVRQTMEQSLDALIHEHFG